MDHPTALTTGVDPDWQSLNEHRLPGIRRVAATSDSLPFSAQTYDLILASWILEHLPFPADTLQQVWRILKPGGAFIFITPNGRHPAAQLNRLLGRLAGLQNILVEQLYGRDRVDTFPTYYRANTRERLYQLANQAGLQLVDLVTVPDPTYLAFSPSMFRLARLIEDNISASRHIHLVGVMRRLE